ncbi:DUF6024 family protein [Brucella intermedia]|uniref:DUF6024 family protein n=1 Tax=Brucella intermedia TaxID=94625 RepID=UPI00224B6CFD|nr:DUF6024 family protein [Brucella intermedia]
MNSRDDRAELRWGVDAAALHPDLQQVAPEGYFRRCAFVRSELKARLARYLDLEHDLFLLSNTSHALVTAIAGLLHNGLLLDTTTSGYSPYAELPSSLEARKAARRVPLLTHADPTTGQVIELPRRTEFPTVLDAAQSFGTIRHHGKVTLADIFICPLHKHVGVSTGLGLIGIKPGLQLPSLRAHAKAAEMGAASLMVLEAALLRVDEHQGRIVNVLTFDPDDAFREVLSEHGVSVLTPNGAGLPFVCLRGSFPDHLIDACAIHELSVKRFTSEGVVRISGALRGTLVSAPTDRRDQLLAALTTTFRS